MRNANDPRVSIREPDRSAAGIPAIAVSVRQLLAKMSAPRAVRSMLRINQIEGFDCPGCAWPERRDRKTAEFCENGAKAVADAATTVRCDNALFEQLSITELAAHDDFWLGELGRLTTPLVRRDGDSHYRPASWDEALDLVADELRALDSPDRAAFYTSGRTSNEAAFAYQLLARGFGTNNLPDCSNMCHEPTSFALGEAIGIGKGTVTFADFDAADLVMVVGQNPGTNHPRMLTVLEEVRRRGGDVLAINPLPEAGLLRFDNPQRLGGLIGRGTPIASLHLPVRAGGDQALFRWLSIRALDAGMVDTAFVSEHTEGFAELRDVLLSSDLTDIARQTGLDDAQLDAMWALVDGKQRIIICWAMGITQHRDAVATIREITNFALMTGNIGRLGSGLSPIRGHSNVQGDRTMGVWEQLPPWHEALGSHFGFAVPSETGLGAVQTMRAMLDGTVTAVVSMGGNLARALPDSAAAEDALARCRLTVSVATKLNRTHVTPGCVSVILPTLTRTDRDVQACGPQSVTVEDSFGTVHASAGTAAPPDAAMLSEVGIVAALGTRLLPDLAPWSSYAADHRTLRADIAAVVPDFEDFERRLGEPGGFLLPHPPRDARRFETPTGRARMCAGPLHPPYGGGKTLILQTLRSHDQYNTHIYGHSDRYRGISGDRRVVLVHRDDLRDRSIRDGDLVDIVAESGNGSRVARRFRAIEYPTPRGNIAGYYPELNIVTDADDVSPESGTPAYKAIPVTLVLSPH